MLSGGLDSILAIRLMQEQGVEVQAVNFSIDFCACIMQNGENVATKAAKMLGLDLAAVSLDTVKMFAKDAIDCGFKL